MVKHPLYLTCAVGTLAVAVPAMAQSAPIPSPAEQSSPAPTGAETQSTTDDTDAARAARAAGKAPVQERADVIVTGNRFSDVLAQPQSKTLIDAEQRNLSGVGDVRQLIDATPGFNYTPDFGIAVRGIGRQTPQTTLGQENPVVEYVDGFISLDPSNIAESTLFGGNVQFLQGPGGTLYGRNSIGGSINLLSRVPTHTFTGEAEGGVGRGGYLSGGVNVSGPLTDNLAFRVGAEKFYEPSIQDNLGSAKGAGFAVNNTYFEFQLDWRVGGFHVRNRATYFQYDNKPAYGSILQYDRTTLFGPLAPNPTFGYTGPTPSQPYQINVDFTGYDRLRGNFKDTLNADLDLGFASLVYVGGYTHYHAFGSSDLDQASRTSYDADTVAPGSFAPGTVVPTYYTANYDNHDSYWSQEARLESKAGGTVKWVAGYYHFEQDNDEYYNNAIPGGTSYLVNPVVGTPGLTGVGPNPNKVIYEQRNIYHIKSNAVFGNAIYSLTPSLRLDAGLRYTWDHKSALTNFRDVFYYPPVYAGDFTPVVHSANPVDSDKALTGRAALAYSFSGASEVYAAYSRGYQSSAFSLGNLLPPGNISKPEFIDVYELGGNYTAGRLRLDGSIFYQNFHDEQIPVSVFQNIVINGVPGNQLGTQFYNAKRAVIWGAESQATWHPNDQSTIVASYTYLNPTFRDFCPTNANGQACGASDITQGGQFFNLTGNDIPRTPRNKATLYGYYGIDLGARGHLYPGGSIVYQSSFYTNPFENPNYRVPGRTVVGFTLTYRTADDRFDLTTSVSNAFAKLYADNVSVVQVGAGTSQLFTYGAQRYFTITGRLRF